MCVLAESRTKSIGRCNAHTWSLEMPASPLPTSVSCWVSHRLELRASEVDEGEAAAVRDANEVSPAGLTKAQPSSAASRTTTDKSDLIAHFTIVPFETRMESRRVCWLLATTTTATHNATRTLLRTQLACCQIKCLPYLHNAYYIVTFQVKNAAGLSLDVDLSCYLSSKQVTCARRWSRSKTGTREKGNRHTNSSFPTVYGPTVYGVDTCVCNDCANLLVFGAEGAPVDAFMS